MEELDGMETFLAADGKVGGAVKIADEQRHTLTWPAQVDGTRASPHRSSPGEIYESLGFEIMERYEFDDQYAPGNWNYELNGRPPVYVKNEWMEMDMGLTDEQQAF